MAPKLLETLWEGEHLHHTTSGSRYTPAERKKLNAVYNVRKDWTTEGKNKKTQQFLEVFLIFMLF